MSEIDKMARELLAEEWDRNDRKTVGYKVRQGDLTGQGLFAVDAIRSALLKAPPGYVLIPSSPTEEMVSAAEDAYMPFGDMGFAIAAAISVSTEPAE